MSYSKRDWILCFAIIRHKNKERPSTKKIKLKRSKIEKLIIPEKFSNLRLNHHLLSHIDIVHRYLLDFERLGGNPEIIKSLSDDIKYVDITRWFLPYYIQVLTILSSSQNDGERRNIKHIFTCFQLIIVSYCCQQNETGHMDSKFILDAIINRFITNNILILKQKSSKFVQQYLEDGVAHFGISCVKKMCQFHCATVASILNLHLRIVHSAIVDNNNEKYSLLFFLVVGRLCYVTESMVYCLINQLLSLTSKKLVRNSLAYNKLYFEREQTFDFQYSDSILHILRQKIHTIQDRIKLLKVIIIELLGTFDQINWDQMDGYVKNHPVHSKTMTKRRLYIQAALLISEDLDLLSKFRLTLWPTWSKIE